MMIALHSYLDPDSPIVVGINLGKNKTSPNACDDYVSGVKKLGQYGDYIVINVSSPNTPGLRDLQVKKQLQDLCDAVSQISVIKVKSYAAIRPL